jgi:hypothetical protein
MDTAPRASPRIQDNATNKTNGISPTTTPAQTASVTPNLVPVQLIILALYPITVLLGILSNHPPESYFARKDNLINVFFLKFSWGWTSLAFLALLPHVPEKTRSLARFSVATIWWYLVTQWCFGPPIMDKVRSTDGLIDGRYFEELAGYVNLPKKKSFRGYLRLQCVVRAVEPGVVVTIWYRLLFAFH